MHNIEAVKYNRNLRERVREKMAKPKYLLIAEEIENEIVMKKYVKGTKLPTEKHFMNAYKVSRDTIRKALNVLVNQNIIKGIKGSGYYVISTEVRIDCVLNEFRTITTMIRDAGLMVGEKKIQIYKRKVKEREIDILKLDKDEYVYIFDRIRTAYSEQLVYSQDILPARHIQEEHIFSYKKGSLSAHIINSTGKKIDWVRAEIATVKKEDITPMLMDEDLSDMLKIEQVHFMKDDKPFFLSIDIFKNDAIRIFVDRH